MRHSHPQIGLALRIVAAFWVLFLAYALWTTGDDNRASPEITTQRVFVTTLLNPKALIVALVLLPQTGLVATIPWITGFSLLVVVAGSFWIGAGAMLIRLSRGAHMSNLPRRIAAVCLAVFSFGIAGSALATML
ncbi:hypothetical protein [Ensifer canadensis]|uniref:hypothetical protein n=1 Tax=Ensifer canadensis TaxID=555315 RepID=UPI0035E3EC25